MKARRGPTGIHLFDRMTGMNLLLDEVQVPESMWSVAPRYVSFALTNACDLSCSFCYAPKHSARLSRQSLTTWSRDLDRAGCLGVGFGGGEPTLYPGLPDLCRELHDETQLAISITTHGHRFTSKLSRQLSGNIDFIRVSMDGVGSTYERIRGRSFAAFEEKLSIIRDTARFGINFVVTEATIRDLPRASEFAFERGAEELLLLPQTAGGDVVLGEEAMDALSAWVQDNYLRCRLASSAHAAAMMDAPILPISSIEHVSHDFLHVDAAGTLKISAFAADGVVVSDHPSILNAIHAIRDGQAIR